MSQRSSTHGSVRRTRFAPRTSNLSEVEPGTQPSSEVQQLPWQRVSVIGRISTEPNMERKRRDCAENVT